MNARGHLPAGHHIPGVLDMSPSQSVGTPRRSGRYNPHHSPYHPNNSQPSPQQHHPQLHHNHNHSPYHHPQQPIQQPPQNQNQHQHQHQQQFRMSQAIYTPPPYVSSYNRNYYPVTPFPNGGGVPNPGYFHYQSPQFNRSPTAPMPHYPPVVSHPGPRRNHHPPHTPVVYQPPPPPSSGPPLPPQQMSLPVPPPPPPPPPQQQSSQPSVPANKPPMILSSSDTGLPAPASDAVAASAVPAQPRVRTSLVVSPQQRPSTQPGEDESPSLGQGVLISGPPNHSARHFVPPLPWFSRPDLDFPSRPARARRRKQTPIKAVELPPAHNIFNNQATAVELTSVHAVDDRPSDKETFDPANSSPVSSVTLGRSLPRSETPSSQDHPSDYAASTSPTTPSSAQETSTAHTTTPPQKPMARATLPALPLIPALPLVTPKNIEPQVGKTQAQTKPGENDHSQANDGSNWADKHFSADKETHRPGDNHVDLDAPAPAPAPIAAASSKAKVGPMLWSGLFAKPSHSISEQAISHSVSGNYVARDLNGEPGADQLRPGSHNNSLTYALLSFRIASNGRTVFVEPRGLNNTGNMCYVNSVLQVLLFCTPFYSFLDHISKQAVHSFKKETPLLDVMIMFIQEFKILESAPSAAVLRAALKTNVLGQYGEPFTPDFIYDAIRKHPRFASMSYGHQQDAEEFLGFLFDCLDDELSRPLQLATSADASDLDAAWQGVGPRLRANVRKSGPHPTNFTTPIAKIFGGQLRSELRVPGQKRSITYEPYQALQLDIAGPHVFSIVDALKGLTRPELLHGDFKSPHGREVQATKQVLVDSLPPVLILHLKRFKFDAERERTVKIWKNIEYPHDLEIPEQVLVRQNMGGSLKTSPAPRYRLTAVIYHHGNNASGGHYTADVCRQDGEEWIRLDDTVIRHINRDEVAEDTSGQVSSQPGSSGDKANSSKSRQSSTFNGNSDTEDGWNRVNTSANGAKKSQPTVNGGKRSRPSSQGKTYGGNDGNNVSGRDGNKVAYLLFYQRV